jgi:hypothetical protein
VRLPSTATIELSRLELDVLWEHLRLGAYPTVFRMMGHGRTSAERSRLVEQAWRSLQARGLGPRGSPDRLLAELLAVLARPQREIDARMNHGDRAVRALAGTRGELAAIGVLTGGTFRFSEITPGGLSRAVVALLPEHPAGSGASVTLPSEVLSSACAAAGRDPTRLLPALVERGLRGEDARQLAEALTGIGGAGQFGVAWQDRWGRRVRADHVVGFVDSAAGRFLLETATPPPGARRWTTIAPTDPIRLAGQIDRLLPAGPPAAR